MGFDLSEPRGDLVLDPRRRRERGPPAGRRPRAGRRHQAPLPLGRPRRRGQGGARRRRTGCGWCAERRAARWTRSRTWTWTPTPPKVTVTSAEPGSGRPRRRAGPGPGRLRRAAERRCPSSASTAPRAARCASCAASAATAATAGIWDGSVISGDEAVDGNYAFQVRVRDAAGNDAARAPGRPRPPVRRRRARGSRSGGWTCRGRWGWSDAGRRGAPQGRPHRYGAFASRSGAWARRRVIRSAAGAGVAPCGCACPPTRTRASTSFGCAPVGGGRCGLWRWRAGR